MLQYDSRPRVACPAPCACCNCPATNLAAHPRPLRSSRDPHNDAAVPLLRLLSGALSGVIVIVAAGVTLIGFGEAPRL